MNEQDIDPSKEFARVIDWNPKWDVGAPLPQVFANGYRTYLSYLIEISDPHWDGSYTTPIKNTDDTLYFLAIVTFLRPNSHRFGIVNDEAASGHPLYEKGLEVYAAYIIENSGWVEELKVIHKVHPYFSEKKWISYKHFLLFFHDEIFEIIAEDYKIEVMHSSFSNVALEIAKRLNS